MSPPLFISQQKDPAMLSLEDDSPLAFSPSKTRLTLDTAVPPPSINLPSPEEGEMEEGLESKGRAKMCPLSPSARSEAASDTLTTISLTSDVSKIRKEGDTDPPTPKKGRKDNEEEDLTEDKEERSRKYVAEFLEKYVMDSTVDEDGQTVPVLRTEHSLDTNDGSESTVTSASNATWNTLNKIGAAKDVVVSSISSGISSVYCYTRKSSSVDSPTELPTEDTHQAPPSPESPLEASTLNVSNLSKEFGNMMILDDPFINPLEAPRHMLEKFPRTAIMTVEFDFCLDDCVCMSKLLRSLGVSVQLDVLSGLPHGFLNLCYLAPETKAGCNKAIQKIKWLLDPQ